MDPINSCLHPASRSFVFYISISVLTELGSAIQSLSINTLPTKGTSYCLFTRDDREITTSYSSPTWKFLASAFSGMATLMSQTFRDGVIFLSLLFSGRMAPGSSGPPQSKNWAFSPSGPFFHFKISPRLSTSLNLQVCPKCGCQRCLSFTLHPRC